MLFKTSIRMMLILMTVLIQCSRMMCAGGDPTINVAPLPSTTTTTFDPKNPPADLKKNEDAHTEIDVQARGGRFDLTSSDGTNFTISNIDPIDISGSITIELPTDAPAQLKSHESGHDRLDRFEYNRTALAKATAAFRGFAGMVFKGVGSTPQERLADAEKQANAEQNRRLDQAAHGIKDQSNTLGDKYDTLTKSGTSKTESSAQGEADAKKELKLAFAPGSVPLTPGLTEVYTTIGTSDPPTVTYNPLTAQLSFDFHSSPVDFSTKGGTDPILGALLAASPLQVIGLQANGTMQLATSNFSISKDGVDVLQGFVIEAAYMPSTLPGFGGMIQGYLDVPPPFTGAGINNTIGSPFLDSYQSALDDPTTAHLSTFWFYTNQPLFDSNGAVLTTFSAGVLKVGMAQSVPEPTGLALFGIGVVACAIRRYRRRLDDLLLRTDPKSAVVLLIRPPRGPSKKDIIGKSKRLTLSQIE